MTSEESFNKETNDVISMANSAKEKRLRDEALENFKKNSLYSEGAEPIICSQKRERVSKSDFKKIIASLLLLATISIGGIVIVNEGIDYIKRENDIRKADEFMHQKIVSIYEKNNVPYMLNDGKILLLENSIPNITELCDYFESYGIDQYEFLYTIYKTGGIESLDKAVKGLGYSGVDNFLYEKYRDPDTGRGSLSRFENNNEVGYVNGVKEILESSKGKSM